MIKLVGQKYREGMPIGHTDIYNFFISKSRDENFDDYYSIIYSPDRLIQHIPEDRNETIQWMEGEGLTNFKLELIYDEGGEL